MDYYDIIIIARRNKANYCIMPEKPTNTA